MKNSVDKCVNCDKINTYLLFVSRPAVDVRHTVPANRACARSNTALICSLRHKDCSAIAQRQVTGHRSSSPIKKPYGFFKWQLPPPFEGVLLYTDLTRTSCPPSPNLGEGWERSLIINLILFKTFANSSLISSFLNLKTL